MNSFGRLDKETKTGGFEKDPSELNRKLDERSKDKLNNKVVKKMKTMVNDEEDGNIVDSILGLVAIMAFAVAIALNIRNSIGLRGTIGLFVVGIVASVAYLNRKKLDS